MKDVFNFLLICSQQGIMRLEVVLIPFWIFEDLEGTS
jgi:hypothetical protein